MTPQNPFPKHGPICLATFDQFGPVQVTLTPWVILGPGVGGWEGRLLRREPKLPRPPKSPYSFLGPFKPPRPRSAKRDLRSGASQRRPVAGGQPRRGSGLGREGREAHGEGGRAGRWSDVARRGRERGVPSQGGCRLPLSPRSPLHFGEIGAERRAHLGKGRARYCRECQSPAVRWSGESGGRIH